MSNMIIMSKTTMPKVSAANVSQEASDFVTRKEAIAKLRVLKLRFDLVYPLKKHKCSFFYLLNDAAYRESSLLKFSYQHDAILSAYANQLLALNLVGSLLAENPDLGKEVFIKIYPIRNNSLETMELIDFPYGLSKLPHYVSAENL